MFFLLQDKREVSKKSKVGLWNKTRDEFSILEDDIMQ